MSGEGNGVRPGGACPACGARAWAPWRAVAVRRVVYCRRCGLGLQLDEPPAAAELYDAAFFAGEVPFGYVDYAGDEAAHRRNARARLRSLRPWVGGGWAGKRVLDVGCAFGFFLDEARRLGAAATGVEVAAAGAAYARERLALTVYAAAFTAAPLADRFDVITMFDYIEHVRAPGEDLARAFALLRPGGALVLSTGDRGAAAARLMGRRWHLIQPDFHLYYFTAPSLRALLARAGFDVVRVTRPGRWLSLGAGVEKLFPGAAARRLRAPVYVNLGDIMEAVARRPA